MSVLDKYADSDLLDGLFALLALVPAGFLLALLIGLIAFGIFTLIGLIRKA